MDTCSETQGNNCLTRSFKSGERSLTTFDLGPNTFADGGVEGGVHDQVDLVVEMFLDKLFEIGKLKKIHLASKRNKQIDVAALVFLAAQVRTEQSLDVQRHNGIQEQGEPGGELG
jgi:hypothetical protein